MTGPYLDFELPIVLARVVPRPVEGTAQLAEQGRWDDGNDGWGGGGWIMMMGFMVIF